jgi:drug/metabolite transporter (DMT)-like permease
VHEPTGSPLAAWETFYVIIGSSAGALIGLQFVVIALLAETRKRSTTREIDAFATPTILHFGAALLVSSVLSAPWPSLSITGIALGICGCFGVGYAVVVIRRGRRQTTYQLVMEDWVWHMALPLIAYTALLGAALTLSRHVLVSLFVVAGTALLLLFIGIHNAWDAVTYIALDHVQAPDVPSAPG